MKIFFPLTLVTLAASMRGISAAAQTCTNGITGVQAENAKGVACCPLTCLNKDGKPECGGIDCGKRNGGRGDCCVSNIALYGEACSDCGEAPCYIEATKNYREGPQTCSNGIAGVEGRDTETGDVACCPLTCLNNDGQPECGGYRCKKLKGGKNSCCVQNIKRKGEACSDSGEAPCYIGESAGSPPTGGPTTGGSMCTADVAGYLDGTVCCPITCGACGGSGCSGFDGGEDFTGGEACCGSGVKDLGRVCSASVGAPCVVA